MGSHIRLNNVFPSTPMKSGNIKELSCNKALQSAPYLFKDWDST